MKEVIEEEIKKTNVSLCGQPTREDDITQAEGIPKVGSRDVKKPTRFKDWNTPWIRRDGKGLKTILRNSSGVDPVAAPVRTSHNHFYSEPHSLLAPEPEPIPLERIEEMREAIARAHDLERRQRAADERPPVRSDEGVRREEANHTPVQPESEVCEGSEPPELEEILENHHREEPSAQQIKANQTQPEKNNNNSLYDVQEEEPQTLESDPGIRQEIEELSEQEATNLLDLETLKKSMEKFSSMSGYEPSADELIQVLKNLENLAASNTPMYMALVQLIQGIVSRPKRK